MTQQNEIASGRHSARVTTAAQDVEVWDPLVRVIHWSVVLMILLNGVFTDDESELHEWVGYCALGLVLIRLVWALIGPNPARFTTFPPSPARALQHLRAIRAGDKTVHLSHNPLGALMVYNLWLTIIGMGVTGYMMTTLYFFGVDWVEGLHEMLFNWLILSVVLHVGGVVFDSRRSGINLVRAMINGRKHIPEGTKVE